MTSYLLDTNIIIDYGKQMPGVVGLVERLVREQRAYVSIITMTELCVGWQDDRADVLFEEVATLFPVEGIARAEALAAARFRRRSQAVGRTLGIADVLIAATAYTHNLCLVTRNVADFPMPEVQLYPYIETLYA
jgi:toxin FitB